MQRYLYIICHSWFLELSFISNANVTIKGSHLQQYICVIMTEGMHMDMLLLNLRDPWLVLFLYNVPVSLLF